jgi:hypothetical protein
MHQHLAKAAKKNKAWQAVQMLVLPSPVNGLFSCQPDCICDSLLYKSLFFGAGILI